MGEFRIWIDERSLFSDR